MKTLTIRLPDDLAKRIERESAARGVSKSDIVRERLHEPAVSAIQEANLRDILETGWAARVPSISPRFRSRKKQKLAEIIRAKNLRH